MALYDEIMSDLELYSRAEKTEFAFRIITSGLIDPDVVLRALGLTYPFSAVKELGEWDAESELTPYDLLQDVPTEEISDYVNDVMKEML